MRGCPRTPFATKCSRTSVKCRYRGVSGVAGRAGQMVYSENGASSKHVTGSKCLLLRPSEVSECRKKASTHSGESNDSPRPYTFRLQKGNGEWTFSLIQNKHIKKIQIILKSCICSDDNIYLIDISIPLPNWKHTYQYCILSIDMRNKSFSRTFSLIYINTLVSPMQKLLNI